MDNPIASLPPKRAALYCATCDATLAGDVNDLLGGSRFLCPKASFWNLHLACVVVPASPMIGWLRFQVRLQGCVAVFESGLPWPSSMRERRVGLTLTLSVACLLFLLIAVAPAHPVIASSIAAFLAFGTLAANTAIVFVSRRPRDAFRTTLLTLLSAAEVTLAFAVFYLSCPSANFDPPINTPIQATYFAAVTFSTVGFGDIHPAPSSAVPQLLVLGQLFVGLYFLTVILTNIVSFTTGSPLPPTVADLIAMSKKLDSNSSAA